MECSHQMYSFHHDRGWRIRVVGLSGEPISRSTLSLYATNPRSLISSLLSSNTWIILPKVPRHSHLGNPPPKPSPLLNPLPSPNPSADPLLLPSFPSLPVIPAPPPMDAPPPGAPGPFCTSSCRPKSVQAGTRWAWVARVMPKAACWSGTTSSSSSGLGGW